GRQLDKRLAKEKRITPELVGDAILAATREAVGSYAIAILHSGLPGHLFGARRGSPLVAGFGNGEMFLASDISPIVAHARKVIYLQDGDIATVTRDGCSISAAGKPIRRPASAVHWSAEAGELGRFPHYMLKEIYEQPARVAD